MTRLVVLVLALTAACSAAPRTLAGGEPQSSLPAPTSELAAEDEAWVAFEARWLCDLERRTYEDPSEIETDLADRLASEDIDPADYEAFQARLDDEPELARHVQAAFLNRCGD